LAVHHFAAPDLIVTVGWQPMATFPQDGRVVEVRDAGNNVSKAMWNAGANRVERAAGASEPVNWRWPE
jgi:YD repeat-containing protein